ncbi:DNA-3-methyladenine glycosylase 2 family protein [Shewanella intestini]|uniref:DNA-3-methyladenine glycosylase II n=1 Tax=Shewanella intestini TaxID=2017544 RepID=A0ABS5I083_9GAMM|nr:MULTISPECIES: AlkA N-terminal domain-containing protein [Shewanella]MBR9727438.1 DNA-3-methyladenine glycosylase 2 family protein [Shewanella intestini]MRG35512.1 helix-turn-helix domain-containing protein [Shewanella sp. XMDDZSB0408]
MSIESQCNLPSTTCQQARLSRDPRFDGLFFTGVLSTGIYCRSTCPAPAPLEKNVRYFDSAIKAANYGLRPCLRCRPDSAPFSNAWLGSQTTFNRAIKLIHQGALNAEQGASVKHLANRLGISPRYLSQLFQQNIGTSPKKYALYQQVMFAKQLLSESRLSITEIALAAGFNSIRRFNEAFKQTLQLTPSAARKKQFEQTDNDKGSTTVSLILSYRPPFDWSSMWQFFQFRLVDAMESADSLSYSRTFEFNHIIGLLTITPVEDKNQFKLELVLINTEDIGQLMPLVNAIRQMFDLDADMQLIEQNMQPYIDIGGKLNSGLRLPGVPTSFEAACRAVLGQQVSVTQATKLLNVLVEEYGEKVVIQGQNYRLFPRPEVIARASLTCFKMPQSRKNALNLLGQYIADNPNSTPQSWLSVKGIGPWTVAYAQMRGARDSDVLLTSDLVIKNGIKHCYKNQNKELTNPQYNQVSKQLAQNVTPWGSYLTLQIWHNCSAKPNVE